MSQLLKEAIMYKYIYSVCSVDCLDIEKGK